MKKKILYGLLVVFFISQFFQIDKTNPPVNEKHDLLFMNPAPDHVSVLIKDACYDCHSNLTEYPWYSYISPISFWLRGHIRGGRQHVNFSDWGKMSKDDRRHAVKECIEVLEDRRMPLKSFTITHPEAKLNEENLKDLIKWFEILKK